MQIITRFVGRSNGVFVCAVIHVAHLVPHRDAPVFIVWTSHSLLSRLKSATAWCLQKVEEEKEGKCKMSSCNTKGCSGRVETDCMFTVLTVIGRFLRLLSLDNF